MGVNVELTGALVARTGVHRAHVPVPEDATLEDVVAGLAREYGSQVRPGLLDGDHLRTDTLPVRVLPPSGETLSIHSPVECGDTVRFEFHA